jgi:hypothetical protein
MWNETVEQIDQDKPAEKEKIGIAESQDELGAAEEIHKAHVDHNPGRKPQAQGEVAQVGLGDEVSDQAA